MPGWGLSLIFWGVLVLANIVTVRAYGEVSIPDVQMMVPC
jgi:AAT family amino acid transporter